MSFRLIFVVFWDRVGVSYLNLGGIGFFVFLVYFVWKYGVIF